MLFEIPKKEKKPSQNEIMIKQAGQMAKIGQHTHRKL